MIKQNPNSLLTMTQNAMAEGQLSPEEAIVIQSKLWSLLAERTERYTMGDSSSVRVETAEALFQSILFSIRLYLNASQMKIHCLIREPLDALLRASWSEIETRLQTGKLLLKQVKETAPQIENISYRDTLQELEQFFLQYEYRFFAHAIPCDIDYQLCRPVSETLEGIEYINAYLTRLSFENRFCGCFDPELTQSLLDSYCPGHRELLINLFEPIAVNAIGLTLLHKSPFPLNIPAQSQAELLFLFDGRSKGGGTALLSQAAETLSDRLAVCDASDRAYIRATAVDLQPRIQAAVSAGSLSHVFFSLSS